MQVKCSKCGHLIALREFERRQDVGVGHVRSLVILVVLVSAFAWLYHFTKPEAFTGFGEALRYSVGVAALQRPEMPREFGEPQKWLHVAEAVLGPIQIALFALALRMRLKR